MTLTHPDLSAESLPSCNVCQLAISFTDASGTFEFLRPGLVGFRGFASQLWSTRRSRARLLTRLKFLMACLEEVNRLRSLKLRIEAARDSGRSVIELEKEISTLKRQPPVDGDGEVFVHTFE